MIALITARITSVVWYCSNAPENTKNLPIKPAVSGMPASDSIEMVSTSARNGFLFARPLNESKLSLPACWCTSINAPNAMIEAIEYAVEYINTELAELAPSATMANNKYPACDILENASMRLKLC